MTNILSIGVQCNTVLQLVGLLITATVIVVIAVLAYKAVTFVGYVILQFCKVCVEFGKGDFHSKVNLHR